MKKLIVVGGPTASGKTTLAIKCAQNLEGELINADSVQIYKGLTIGSNKGNLSLIRNEVVCGRTIPVYELEKSGVPGHLFDICDPDELFDVAHYKKLADEVILSIQNKDMHPILVGGTGLYIDAVIKNYDLSSKTYDASLRKELESSSVGELQDRLQSLKPGLLESLNNSDRNNPRRLLRYIEKEYESTSSQESNCNKPREDILFLYPEFEREELYNKIDKRVVEMFEEGFVDEVKQILDQGYSPNSKSLQSTGYKQIVMLLQGKIASVQECIQAVQQAHRNYAKRQITWFEGDGRGYNLHTVSSESILDLIVE